jgi:hypothetical protein
MKNLPLPRWSEERKINTDHIWRHYLSPPLKNTCCCYIIHKRRDSSMWLWPKYFCLLSRPTNVQRIYIDNILYTGRPPYPRNQYPQFTVAWKKFGKLKNKLFISFKTRAKWERAITWWNPAAQMHPVLDSCSVSLYPRFPTMALGLGSTQPLTEMSTRCISWG